jgi:hypothetical protein
MGSYEHASACANCLDLRRMTEKVRSGKRLSINEKNRLNFARLTEEDLLAIGEQIEKYGEKSGGKLLNLDLWENQTARENYIYAIHQWRDLDVMSPGIESPKLGPMGEFMLQYKKYMIPAYERCLLPAIQRLAAGDYMIE